jgi:hypothetical protein
MRNLKSETAAELIKVRKAWCRYHDQYDSRSIVLTLLSDSKKSEAVEGHKRLSEGLRISGQDS